MNIRMYVEWQKCMENARKAKTEGRRGIRKMWLQGALECRALMGRSSVAPWNRPTWYAMEAQ